MAFPSSSNSPATDERSLSSEELDDFIHETIIVLSPLTKRLKLEALLLRRPPIRYVRDILMQMSEARSFLPILLSEEEVKINFKEKGNTELKISFFEKFIKFCEAICMCKLNVRGKDIVIGINAYGTCRLLRCLGEILSRDITEEEIDQALLHALTPTSELSYSEGSNSWYFTRVENTDTESVASEHPSGGRENISDKASEGENSTYLLNEKSLSPIKEDSSLSVNSKTAESDSSSPSKSELRSEMSKKISTPAIKTMSKLDERKKKTTKLNEKRKIPVTQKCESKDKIKNVPLVKTKSSKELKRGAKVENETKARASPKLNNKPVLNNTTRNSKLSVKGVKSVELSEKNSSESTKASKLAKTKATNPRVVTKSSSLTKPQLSTVPISQKPSKKIEEEEVKVLTNDAIPTNVPEASGIISAQLILDHEEAEAAKSKNESFDEFMARFQRQQEEFNKNFPDAYTRAYVSGRKEDNSDAGQLLEKLISTQDEYVKCAEPSLGEKADNEQLVQLQSLLRYLLDNLTKQNKQFSEYQANLRSVLQDAKIAYENLVVEKKIFRRALELRESEEAERNRVLEQLEQDIRKQDRFCKIQDAKLAYQENEAFYVLRKALQN